MSVLRRIPFEAYFWAAGLAALAYTDPAAEGLFSLCLFKAAGLPFCPGCGLGHSIAYLFRGDLAAAWAAHPLGPFALVFLIGHVARLLREAFTAPERSVPRRTLSS